jgi:hypothetical protein
MSLDLRPRPDDTDNKLLQKITQLLFNGGGGGGGGGGGAVTVADGSDVAEGTTTDSRATNSTSAWTVIALLKGLYQNTSGGGSAVSIADGSDVTQGAKADAANTDSTSAWTVVSLLKGIWAKLAGTLLTSNTNIDVALSTRLKPADTLAAVTSITNPVAVTNAGLTNIDVALSTRLKPADTLAAVTTVGTITNPVTVAGNVGGKTTVIKDTTAVSSSPAYTAGDAVGGKRTLTNALLAANTGVLQSVNILDRANQKAAMTLYIFDADPTNATITDNAAFVFSTDDLKVIAQVNISTTDYVTNNSKAFASIGGLNISLKAGGTTLYAALVTAGTPTFAATTDVQIEVGILQD